MLPTEKLNLGEIHFFLYVEIKPWYYHKKVVYLWLIDHLFVH